MYTAMKRWGGGIYDMVGRRHILISKSQGDRVVTNHEVSWNSPLRLSLSLSPKVAGFPFLISTTPL